MMVRGSRPFGSFAVGIRNRRRPKTRALSLVRYAVFISLNVLIVTGVLLALTYGQMRREVVRLLSAANERAVQQVRDTTDLVVHQTVTLLHRVFVDARIQPLLFGPDISPADLTLGIESLREFAVTGSNVRSIYVVNRAADRVFTSEGPAPMYELRQFYDSDIIAVLSGNRRVPLWSPLFRNAPAAPSPVSRVPARPVFTFVIAELERPGNPVSHAIVLNLETTWFETLLLRLVPSSGATFVRGPDSTVFFRVADDGWDATIEESSISLDGSDRRLVVASAASERSGWTYVAAQPVQSLLATFRRTSQAIVAVASAIILVGVLISVGVSVVLYRPVGTLKEQFTELQDVEANHRHRERALFVDRLLHLPLPIVGLEATDIYRHIPEAESAAAFSILTIRIESSDHTPEWVTTCIDASAETLGVTAVARVDDSTHVVALLLAPPPNEHATLESLCAEISAQLADGTSIGVSNTATDLSTIATSLKQAEAALAYRVFTGERNVVRYESIPGREAGFSLPPDLAFRIGDALLAGDVDDACERCSTAIAATQRHGVAALESTIIRIASAFLRTVDILHQPAGTEAYADAGRLMRRMNEQPTLERLSALCCDCCRAIVQAAKEASSRGGERAVAVVRHIIEEEYAELNLSLPILADRVGLSSRYLGRLFKHAYGVSVADYLTRVRIDAARRLLVETTTQVKEIARGVGFVNDAYFVTRFKRNTGVTPAAYRRQRIAIESPSDSARFEPPTP